MLQENYITFHILQAYNSIIIKILYQYSIYIRHVIYSMCKNSTISKYFLIQTWCLNNQSNVLLNDLYPFYNSDWVTINDIISNLIFLI